MGHLLFFVICPRSVFQTVLVRGHAAMAVLFCFVCGVVVDGVAGSCRHAEHVFVTIPIDGVSDAQSKGFTSAVCAEWICRMSFARRICQVIWSLLFPPEDAERGAGASASVVMCLALRHGNFAAMIAASRFRSFHDFVRHASRLTSLRRSSSF